MKSFSTPVIEDVPVEFEIDGDKFRAIPANKLPGGALNNYFKSVNAGDIFEAHHAFFKVVLDEESYVVFEERFNSTERPITLQMLGEVSTWLLGTVYMGNGEEAETKNETLPVVSARKASKRIPTASKG